MVWVVSGFGVGRGHTVIVGNNSSSGENLELQG